MIREKYCPRCKMTRPAAAFNRRSASWDGLQGYCRECCSERQLGPERDAARRAMDCAALPQNYYDPEGTKRCSGCGEAKPLSRFARRKRSKDGRQHYCRDCANEAARMERARDPERVRARVQKYREKKRKERACQT